MKWNLATVLSLLVSLAGLVTAWVTGALQSHPDVIAVLVAVNQIVTHFLDALVKPEPKKEIAP